MSKNSKTYYVAWLDEETEMQGHYSVEFDYLEAAVWVGMLKLRYPSLTYSVAPAEYFKAAENAKK